MLLCKSTIWIGSQMKIIILWKLNRGIRTCQHIIKVMTNKNIETKKKHGQILHKKLKKNCSKLSNNVNL